MPADLNNPFGPSCCDGGDCNTEEKSAQPCGCDRGANWICAVHQAELDELEKLRESNLND